MKKLLVRRECHGWSWPELSRRSGLPVWKLHWWRRRLAKAKRSRRAQRAFVPVQVVEAARCDSPPLELSTPSGISIRVPAQFDGEHLRRLLKAVESC